MAGIPVLALSQQIHVPQDIASQPPDCSRISAASWNAAAVLQHLREKTAMKSGPMGNYGHIRDSGSAALSARL